MQRKLRRYGRKKEGRGYGSASYGNVEFQLLEELTVLDPVRTNYWNHQRMLVESQLQRALLTATK